MACESRDMTQHTTHATSQQAAALKNGRRALAEGRPVIWIHGRAYQDPAADSTNEDRPMQKFIAGQK